MRWSPYPRSAYTIKLDDGSTVGFGAHLVFDIIPGAWNIFWLTFPQIDQTAFYKGDPDKYPVTCDALAVCVGAAMQVASPINANSMGALASQLKPREFIEAARSVPTFLPFIFYGKRWFSVASRRAERYRVTPNNVLVGDFGRKS